ncbi:4Fe-4S dicluster domain-containing protein [Limisalsivibrio acetivorans]|uniref:4Fe-4S dicluster domain-containing protein n=1 Tax=Limisalsivibrio acetivorans TaxID=1304888 RepID=UPI001EE33CDB|nr:4Fe-4S dicluster domain-containing protein [Limisalsivibrio acetivorans]
MRNTLNNNPFKGFFKKNRLRPPGAVEEKRFMELCIRCARCIEVCPYDSVKRADLFEKLQIGTPYIFAEERACYLCMKCPPVCPTGALDPELAEPENVRIGIAVIDQETCLNYLYLKAEKAEEVTGAAMICSTCYNVCPFTDEAIIMKEYILPVITDKCTGCGICVEKCPTEPRSVEIIPTGMGDADRAGIYYQKSRKHFVDPEGAEGAVKKKRSIDSTGDKPEFEYDFDVQEGIEGWE